MFLKKLRYKLRYKRRYSLRSFSAHRMKSKPDPYFTQNNILCIIYRFSQLTLCIILCVLVLHKIIFCDIL